MQSSPREILSPVLCVCVFVPVCVFVIVCETVPVGKKLISRSVSPWFLGATEGNTIIYAAGDGREETICIPESSQSSLSNLKHLFPLFIDIKRVILDGFVLDCVKERSSIWRLHSFSRAFLSTSWLSHLSIPDLQWVWPSVLHTKGVSASTCMSLICIYSIFEEIMVWASYSHLHCCQRAPAAWKGEGMIRGIWGSRSQAKIAHDFPHGASHMRGWWEPTGQTSPRPPTPFGLSLITPRPVLWQAEAGVLKLRIHLLLGSFSKMEMFWVALPAMCTQVVRSTETSKETQVCVFPSHPLLGRGEGQGLGHHNTLPVPSHWRIKKIFVLNLSGFHNFYLNLGYAGNCKRQGGVKGESAVIPNESDSLKYNDLCTNLNGKTEY